MWYMVRSKSSSLDIPPESDEIRRFIKAVREQLGPTSGVDWDSFAVWAGNKIPQYLWATWKEELKSRGITWPKFLRVMRYRTGDAIRWFYGRITWEEFVEEVIESIEGDLGKIVAEK